MCRTGGGLQCLTERSQCVEPAELIHELGNCDWLVCAAEIEKRLLRRGDEEAFGKVDEFA